jgi:hypothetical protein
VRRLHASLDFGIVGPSYRLLYFVRIEAGNITVGLVKTLIVIVTSRCTHMHMCRLTTSFGGAILSESRKEAHLGKKLRPSS